MFDFRLTTRQFAECTAEIKALRVAIDNNTAAIVEGSEKVARAISSLQTSEPSPTLIQLEEVKFMFKVTVDQAPVPYKVDLSGVKVEDDKGNTIPNEKLVVSLVS